MNLSGSDLTTKIASQSSAKEFTVTTDNLGKRFSREWIFRSFNHTFTSGNTYAITGPNGSGKSTLLQVLSGFIPPSCGTLHYRIENQSLPVEDVFRHLALATPYMDLVEEFTLREQVEFHFRLKKPRHALPVEGLVEQMQLSHAQSKFIGNFSSGMKQRVKLALAFYTDAQLILLDEPGTNLDLPAFRWYEKELSGLPSNCLVMIASNNAREYPGNAMVVNIMDYK
jgi:ABC-type multidrug transport system ATPase subunit